MQLLTITRAYLGLSQTALAKAAGITQADLSEMETKAPYGKIGKYQRLSNYLGIPVEAIAKNDFTCIPESFFETHPAQKYLPAPISQELLLGRQGEEFILCWERESLTESQPVLAKLVLPFYKMKCSSPGYDILTFDDAGKPYYLEVKTSIHDTQCFRLTNHELDVAKTLTAAGERYVLCYISQWGTADQQVQDLPFSELEKTRRIEPHYYFCRPNPKPKKLPMSGLAYYRLLREMKQADVATALDVFPCDLSMYETCQRTPSIEVFLKASEVLEATMDQLMARYDAPPAETEAIYE